MLRYINTFTRYMWLLLIPLIAAPVLFASMLTFTASYSVVATLWVEQPLYISQQRNSDGSGSDSPSAQTATMLRELVSTRAFLNTVLDTPPLKNSLKNDNDRNAILDGFAKNLKIEANGWRLISLTFKSDQPKRGGETLDSLMTRFKAYYDDRINTQSQNAIAFYEKQLKTSSEALDKANADLKKFLATNQGKIDIDAYARPQKPEEIEYSSLILARDLARKQYDDASQGLTRVQASYGAFQQGQDTYMKIQDRPDVPAYGGSRSSQLIIGAAIGLAIGLVITLLLTIILTLLDRTLRQPNYARQLLGVDRVLEVPTVSSNRSWSVKNIGGSNFVLRRSLAKQLQATEARRLKSRNP